MAYYLLTAAGPDRPGIVAAAAKILYSLGCNLEDSAMTRLQGEFAILLMFTAPASLKPSVLASRVRSLEKSHKLSVHLKALTPRESRARDHGPQRLCLVAVYGADRPGIVYRVSD